MAHLIIGQLLDKTNDIGLCTQSDQSVHCLLEKSLPLMTQGRLINLGHAHADKADLCLCWALLVLSRQQLILFLFAAYEVLSDQDKRRHYDQFGEEGEQMGGGGNGHGFDFNFDDFFKGFDDAFKTHHDRHQQNHFKFHFGGNGNGHRAQFFNFDDLFDDDDDDDDDIFSFDPFGDSETISFGFGDSDEDFFGHNKYDRVHNVNGHVHNQHRHQQNMNNHQQRMHQHQQHMHNHMKNHQQTMHNAHHTRTNTHNQGKRSNLMPTYDEWTFPSLSFG